MASQYSSEGPLPSYTADASSNNHSNFSYASPYQTMFRPPPFSQISQPVSQSSASSYADMHYLFGAQDPSILATTKLSRGKRRSSQTAEFVKHRRTRSGCYTCRSRRVKCDERHPICERCKKGGRECTYPEAASGPKAANGPSEDSAKAAGKDDIDSSGDEGNERDESYVLGPIIDEEEEDGDGDGDESPTGNAPLASVNSGTVDAVGRRIGSETPSLTYDKFSSPSPSTGSSTGWNGNSNRGETRSEISFVQQLYGAPSGRRDWSQMPQDLQFYLAYFYDNITYHHYSLKNDAGDFLRVHFLDAALENDALLHAIVGFAAFHHTLQDPKGKISQFLQYYNKAVSLLLLSLQGGLRHNMGTLLTILQLATIEEYLGDWVNLLGHQKAAYEILTGLYTPTTVMETEMTRMVLGWYTRFDVFAGLLAGVEAVLSREWFSSARQYCEDASIKEPQNVNWKIEEAIWHLRLIAMDMSMVFAKIGKGELALDQFLIENEKVGNMLSGWQANLDPALKDPKWLVKDFSGAPPPDPDDIVDPYLQNTLYYGPIWATNQAMIDWYSINLMHGYQTALTLQSQPSKELAMNAFASCQLFEAVQYWPHSPKGSVIACQASLGIAALFLPQDKTHHMWCRRKLAVIESMGYIYPLTFRTKMSALFQDPSCNHWWLPSEENYPPVIRSIRKFVESRSSQARDAPTEDLHNMKAIFSSLKLDDT